MMIGEIMVKMGFISDDQLQTVIREQKDSRESSEYVETIGNILLRKGVITDEQHNLALVEYFKYLANDESQPAYVKETAKVAMRAIERKSSNEKLSEETKLTVLKKIHEYEEKIAYDEKSINALGKLEPKKVIMDTIEKEKKEIKSLLQKIDVLKKDLERFS